MASNNENFYKRLKELSGVKNGVNESNGLDTRTLVNFERTKDGTAYGIVKENHSYFIKKSLVSEGNLKTSDFTYINGVENRGKYEFKSLGEAEKQRNFYVKGINEAWDQGGVYFKDENTLTKNPSLEVKEDLNSMLRNRITEGKKNILADREKKFKTTHSPATSNDTKKTGLMPEAANVAVKKALGLLNEETVVTADSEIKDKDKVSEKKGKEESTAPITDKNAKKEADKATATGKDTTINFKKESSDKKSTPKKGDDSKSIAVNQANKALKEGEDLVTADSEIITDESPANSNASKEAAQAPINDENAKKEAEKRDAKGAASAAISNNTDEQDESEPFDDKENAGDETGDIVTEGKKTKINEDQNSSVKKLESKGFKVDKISPDPSNSDVDIYYMSKRKGGSGTLAQVNSDGDVNGENLNSYLSNMNEDVDKGEPFDKKAKDGSKDIVAADSDQKETDRVANSKKVTTKPESSHTDKNQPEKGHKENKGTELKAKATQKPIGESKDIITADSEIKDGDKVANKTKTNLPKKTGKSEITADSELEAAKALANMTKTNLPNPIAESDMDESDSLITADSEIEAKSSPANDVSEAGDDGEKELDAAASALDDLDVATDAEETPAAEPAMDATGEEPMADAGAEEGGEDAALAAAGEEPMADAGAEDVVDEPATDDAGAEEGGEDLMTKEIEKLVGKLTQKVRNTDLTPDQAKGFLKSVIDSFETDLGEVDVEDRKEMSDKILKAQTGDIGDDSSEEPMADAGAEEGGDDAADAIDNKIADLGDEAPVEEPVLDEPVKEYAEMTDDNTMGDEGCSECGTFEAYMESRGYSKDDLSECSAGEMGNIVNGYAQAHEEGKNDGDFENIALYVTPEVANEVREYGSGGFVDKLQPYLDNISEDQQMKFGMHEPTMAMEEDDEELDGADDSAEVDVVDAPEMDVEAPEVADVEVTPAALTPAPEVSFAGSGQVLGAGLPKPAGASTKSVDVDLMTGKVSVQVSENELRIRKYVKNKLDELAGKKKPTLDENKKSDTIKKLDRLIEQQWKLYGNQLKEETLAAALSKNGKK